MNKKKWDNDRPLFGRGWDEDVKPPKDKKSIVLDEDIPLFGRGWDDDVELDDDVSIFGSHWDED